MMRQVKVGLVEFRKDHTEPPIRKAHLLPTPEEMDGVIEADNEDGEINENSDEAGLLVMPSVIHKQAQVAVKFLRKIFEGKSVFQNPKDHEVIARLIRYVTGPNDLILDSFAGSGTTGHAVLQINKEDLSNRNFILIEILEDVARNVTSERLRRVSAGIGGTPILGGGFQFCRLSNEPLFTAAGQIRPDVSFAQLAEFVWFAETGTGYSGKADSPLIGIHDGRAIYLLYNGILKDRSTGGGNVLTGAVYDSLPPHDGPKVIYAAACRLGAARLMREGIVFKQTPYALEV